MLVECIRIGSIVRGPVQRRQQPGQGVRRLQQEQARPRHHGQALGEPTTRPTPSAPLELLSSRAGDCAQLRGQSCPEWEPRLCSRELSLRKAMVRWSLWDLAGPKLPVSSLLCPGPQACPSCPHLRRPSERRREHRVCGRRPWGTVRRQQPLLTWPGPSGPRSPAGAAS